MAVYKRIRTCVKTAKYGSRAQPVSMKPAPCLKQHTDLPPSV